MSVAPIPVPAGKVDFYYDNPGAAVDDIEYLMGVAWAAKELLEKMAADPGADAGLRAQAFDLAKACEAAAKD